LVNLNWFLKTIFIFFIPFSCKEILHVTIKIVPHHLSCVHTLPKKNTELPFCCCSQTLLCTFDYNSVTIFTSFNNFRTNKTGNNLLEWGVHLLVTYDVNQVLLMTSLFVLMTFAVNHIIDEWRHGMSARVNTEGRHFEHCLCLLLSKWQCHNGSTVNMIIGVGFSVFFCCEHKWTTSDSILTAKVSLFQSKISTQLRWCGRFYYSYMQNFLQLKWYKSSKDWLRLSKFVVKYKVSHFLCTTVYAIIRDVLNYAAC